MTHDDALRWAAEARQARHDLVEDLATGRLTLSGALDRVATDDHVASMRVLTLLEAVPGASKIGTRRALAELGLAERTPLADVDAAAVVARFGSPA